MTPLLCMHCQLDRHGDCQETACQCERCNPAPPPPPVRKGGRLNLMIRRFL